MEHHDQARQENDIEIFSDLHDHAMKTKVHVMYNQQLKTLINMILLHIPTLVVVQHQANTFHTFSIIQGNVILISST